MQLWEGMTLADVESYLELGANDGLRLGLHVGGIGGDSDSFINRKPFEGRPRWFQNLQASRSGPSSV